MPDRNQTTTRSRWAAAYLAGSILSPVAFPRQSTRPGCIVDSHKKLVQELNSILDRAAVEYDQAEDVVDDFTAYLKDWLSERQIRH